MVGVPGQVIARSRPAHAAPPDSTSPLPDLVGASLHSLLGRVGRAGDGRRGHGHGHDVRPSESGVWSGEDFSI